MILNYLVLNKIKKSVLPRTLNYNAKFNRSSSYELVYDNYTILNGYNVSYSSDISFKLKSHIEHCRYAYFIRIMYKFGEVIYTYELYQHYIIIELQNTNNKIIENINYISNVLDIFTLELSLGSSINHLLDIMVLRDFKNALTKYHNNKNLFPWYNISIYNTTDINDVYNIINPFIEYI